MIKIVINEQMTEVERDRCLKELEDFEQLCESPRLYLADFFIDLRNQVDFQIVSKQTKVENLQQLNKIWIKIIKKIDSFEKECANNPEEKTIKKRLNDTLEYELIKNNFKYNSNCILLNIQNEEENILKKLFKNKTIAFLNCKDFADKSKRELIERKLVVINDEFIRPKALKLR